MNLISRTTRGEVIDLAIYFPSQICNTHLDLITKDITKHIVESIASRIWLDLYFHISESVCVVDKLVNKGETII